MRTFSTAVYMLLFGAVTMHTGNDVKVRAGFVVNVTPKKRSFDLQYVHYSTVYSKKNQRTTESNNALPHSIDGNSDMRQRYKRKLRTVER